MNFRLLLLPFSLVYGLGVFFRNKLYDIGIFRENEFDVSVISVGNLTTGGSGKTPHIEYLIKLLSSNYHLASLSRGYGRKTEGFAYVELNSMASEVGDEPLQLKSKFREIVVTVSESRKAGIERILQDYPKTSIILLDDAFQHRSVKPSVSILLSEYSKFFTKDYLLPAGNMREPFSSKKRADVIVISKCPSIIEDERRNSILQKIKLSRKQKIFFSSLSYSNPKSIRGNLEIFLDKNTFVLLVTGIANATEIISYVSEQSKLIRHLEFSDHHLFTDNEVEKIVKIFSNIVAENKIILTTEKDSMRMKNIGILNNLPVFFLPVEVKFSGKEDEEINKIIIDHVGKN